MSNIIWESKIRGDYTVAADRINATTAQLTVTSDVTNRVLLDQTVPLEFGAQGVSTRDISSWYDMAVVAIETQ